MKIFRIYQEVDDFGIRSRSDVYDSAVVVAKDAKSACLIHPRGFLYSEKPDEFSFSGGTSWVDLKDVKVEEIGIANSDMKENKVICASFNAG